MAQLRGPGGDAESGFHHWLLPAECHHTSTGRPDGQVWAAPHPPGRQVMAVYTIRFVLCMDDYQSNISKVDLSTLIFKKKKIYFLKVGECACFTIL